MAPVAGEVVIIDSEAVSLRYHPRTKIVHHELHRYPGASKLEAALEKGLTLLLEHAAHKWLSDDRNSGALPRAHHEWAETDWGPRAALAGWKYWALIPPTEMLGHMNMTRIREIYASLGVKVCIFKNAREALAWLEQCPD